MTLTIRTQLLKSALIDSGYLLYILLVKKSRNRHFSFIYYNNTSSVSITDQEERAMKPHDEQRYYLIGDINQSGWRTAIKDISQLLDGHNHVHLLISSLGGTIHGGLKFGLQFDNNRGRITTTATGSISSMAIIPLLAGHKRRISSGAFLGFHQIGKTDSTNESQLSEVSRKNLEKVIRLYAEMIAEVTLLSVNDVLTMMENNRDLSAEEAKEYGMVTDIV